MNTIPQLLHLSSYFVMTIGLMSPFASNSLHDFFGRYIMEFEQSPKTRSIIYMKKVKLRVEHGKSG